LQIWQKLPELYLPSNLKPIDLNILLIKRNLQFQKF